MKLENPDNDQDLPGHTHASAELIAFPDLSDQNMTESKISENGKKWHAVVAYSGASAILGGILALPAIEMIESKHGFNFEIPGSNEAGMLVVAGLSAACMAVYTRYGNIH